MTATAPPAPVAGGGGGASGNRRGIIAAVITVVVLLHLALGVVVLAATLGDDTPKRQPVVYSYVVPEYTSLLIDKGEHPMVVPDRLNVRVGDKIVIVNDDKRDQEVGPFIVRSGETLEYKFTEKGSFQGACSVHPSGQFLIIVT